jgi:hypothetical protein
MTSLILTVIAIVLLSATALITVNFTPGSAKESVELAPVIRRGALQLEQAFMLYAKAHDGAAPAVTGQQDGGLKDTFSAYQGFLPAVAPGYQWIYGNSGGSAQAGYANTSYFCLAPLSPGALTSRGKIGGAQRAQLLLSPEQAFVAPSCGATSNASYETLPAQMSFTFFVRYVPGQI